MPNTVTIAATKANTTRAIEYSVDGGLTWADANIFTAVPAGTLAIGQVKARLVGSAPAVVATWGSAVVVAGAAQAAPTISSFTPTSGTVNSTMVITGTGFAGATVVSVNSGAVASFTVNSATQITAVLTGAQATGLVRVTTGAGTAVSAASFTVTAAVPADVVLWIGQSNDSGLSPRTGLATQYFNTNTRLRSWDQTTGTAGTYSLGSIGGGGFPVGNNDHAIDKRIVPSYDNGIGPDVGFAYAWAQAHAADTAELFFFKKDLTPPTSTDGASITAWLNGVNSNPPLYNGFYTEWQAFRAWLTANGRSLGTVTFFCGIGEQDSNDGNTNFAGSLTQFITRFRTDGVLAATSKVFIHQKQRTSDGIIATAQASYANANATTTTLLQLASPTFLGDQTHYTQDAMLRLGALDYQAYSGQLNAGSATTITSFSPAAAQTNGGTTVTVTGTNFTGATAVSIGGRNKPAFTVVSATELTFQVIDGDVSGYISITTPAGTATSNAPLSVGATFDSSFAPFTALAFAPLAAGVTLTGSVYRTSATDGQWSPGGLSGLVLPGSAEGGVSTVYDGTNGHAMIGFSYANAYSPSYQIDFGFYFEAVAGGGHGIRCVKGAAVDTFLLKMAVPGGRYMVYKYYDPAVSAYLLSVWESIGGTLWNYLKGFPSYTQGAPLSPQFKLLGQADAALTQTTRCGGFM